MGGTIGDRITELLAEHESTNTEAISSLDASDNDLQSVSRLDTFGEKIDSGKLAVGPWSIQLEDDLSEIEVLLSRHFSREEEFLAECCEIFDDAALSDFLNWLRSDHRAIIDGIDNLRAQVREIVPAVASRGDWIKIVSQARAHLADTRALLQKHAQEEEAFFRMLSDRLSVYSH